MYVSNVTYPDLWKDQLIHIIFSDQEQNVWDLQGFLSSVLLVICCLKTVFLGSILIKNRKLFKQQ